MPRLSAAEKARPSAGGGTRNSGGFGASARDATAEALDLVTMAEYAGAVLANVSVAVCSLSIPGTKRPERMEENAAATEAVMPENQVHFESRLIALAR